MMLLSNTSKMRKQIKSNYKCKVKLKDLPQPTDKQIKMTENYEWNRGQMKIRK